MSKRKPPAPEKAWLCGSEVALYIGISFMCLHRWRQDEQLGFPPPSQIRNRNFWQRDTIDAWMRSRVASKINSALSPKARSKAA
jgi:predicted DNA-binding transcriptional regulator AlpA